MFYLTWLQQPFADGELAILNEKYNFPDSRGAVNGIVAHMLLQEPSRRPAAQSIRSMCERALLEGADKSVAPPVARPAPPSLSPGSSGTNSKSPRSARMGVSPRSPRKPTIPNEQILSEAKQCLADVKALRDPDAWRMEIAPEISSPVVEDIAIKSYKIAARPFAASKNRIIDLFSLFRTEEKGGNFTVRGKPADVLQMLSIFHLALQSGSFLCMASGVYHKAFLEDVVSQDTDVLRLYAQFLLEKTHYHSVYRFIEGNMSLGTFHMIMQLNGMKTNAAYSSDKVVTPSLFNDGLTLFEKVLGLQSRLIELNQSNGSIAMFLIPIVKESFSIMTVLAYFVQTSPAAVPADFVEKFNFYLGTLRADFAKLNSIQTFLQAMGPPPPIIANIGSGAAGVISYPPSHSPFVVSFLGKQRQAAAAAAAAAASATTPEFPTTFEASFDANFPPPAAAVEETASEPPATVSAAPVDAEPSFNPTPPPVAMEEKPAKEPKKSAEVLERAKAGPRSKIKEERLRRVGSRRGSVADITSMRESTSALKKEKDDTKAFKELESLSKEELIQQVVSLKNRVAELETALGEATVKGLLK
jgi:hypothetical protein